MTELEKTKKQIITTLLTLCARCKDGTDHVCPIKHVAKEIEDIRGIPVKVNDQLYHVMFN